MEKGITCNRHARTAQLGSMCGEKTIVEQVDASKIFRPTEFC